MVGRATAHAAPDFPFTIRYQKSWRAGIRNSHGFSRLLLLGSVVDFHRNRCTVWALGILGGYLQGRLYIYSGWSRGVCRIPGLFCSNPRVNPKNTNGGSSFAKQTYRFDDIAVSAPITPFSIRSWAVTLIGIPLGATHQRLKSHLCIASPQPTLAAQQAFAGDPTGYDTIPDAKDARRVHLIRCNVVTSNQTEC